MSQSAKLYSFADVDRSGKVRWTAAEVGLDIEEARLQVGQQTGAEYLTLNPYGLIPTLQIGPDVLIDSTAISLVLAERHPDAGLIPAGGAERERFWQLVAVATTTLEMPVVNYFLSGRGFMDERWQDLLATDLRRLLGSFAGQAPEEGYLCGAFSLADIFAGYVLRIGIQANLLVNEGRLGAYIERLRSRPAAQQARIFDSLAA